MKPNRCLGRASAKHAGVRPTRIRKHVESANVRSNHAFWTNNESDGGGDERDEQKPDFSVSLVPDSGIDRHARVRRRAGSRRRGGGSANGTGGRAGRSANRTRGCCRSADGSRRCRRDAADRTRRRPGRPANTDRRDRGYRVADRPHARRVGGQPRRSRRGIHQRHRRSDPGASAAPVAAEPEFHLRANWQRSQHRQQLHGRIHRKSARTG